MSPAEPPRIQLGGHRGGPIRGWAAVDPDDFEWLSQWRWSVQAKGYAGRRDRHGQLFLMHRVILGLERGDPREGDHINRDRFDNRRSNLRIVSRAANCQNVPARGDHARGVRRTHYGRWQAFASSRGGFHHLGVFDTPEEAARAASAFRREHMPYAVEAP